MKLRALIFWSSLLLASVAFAQEESKAVKLPALPRPVQKAVQLWLAGGSLDSIDQVQEKGRVTYEIDFTNKEGKDRDFTLAANGTLLSIEVALADTPTAVQKAIKNEAGAGMLDSIEKNLDGEDPTYDITLVAKNGQDRDFTLDTEGKVISRQVTLEETPDAVQRAIKGQAGGQPIADIEKVVDEDSTVSYQAALTAPDRSSSSFSVDGETGQLESVEIDLAAAPPAAQKTIATEIGGGQLESLDKILDPDGTVYEAAYYTKAGRERRFTVGADGKLDSQEVELAAAPPPVQAIIKQQLGDGKVLRIEHSFVAKESGVFPFEVQAEKDGKPFDFSVGPKGRFLGMDD